MKVTLAYPYKNHKAGTTVDDLDDQEALDLLHSGRARKPDTPAHAATASGTSTKEKKA